MKAYFLAAAEKALAEEERSLAFRAVMKFLLENAVGCENARPWGEIDRHLWREGIVLKKTAFQQTVLNSTQSKESNIFIGSTDRGKAAGYFLIRNKEDAEVAREFYTRRIEAQRTNLDHLELLLRLT